MCQCLQKAYPNSSEPQECSVSTTAHFLMTFIRIIPYEIILTSPIKLSVPLKQAPCFIHLCMPRTRKITIPLLFEGMMDSRSIVQPPVQENEPAEIKRTDEGP